MICAVLLRIPCMVLLFLLLIRSTSSRPHYFSCLLACMIDIVLRFLELDCLFHRIRRRLKIRFTVLVDLRNPNNLFSSILQALIHILIQSLPHDYLIPLCLLLFVGLDRSLLFFMRYLQRWCYHDLVFKVLLVVTQGFHLKLFNEFLSL